MVDEAGPAIRSRLPGHPHTARIATRSGPARTVLRLGLYFTRRARPVQFDLRLTARRGVPQKVAPGGISGRVPLAAGGVSSRVSLFV